MLYGYLVTMAWSDSAVVLLFAAVTITTLLTPAQSQSKFISFVRFEHETYSIGEGNGSVEVCVKVSEVLRNPLSVSLTTVDGSATGEQCYL